MSRCGEADTASGTSNYNSFSWKRHRSQSLVGITMETSRSGHSFYTQSDSAYGIELITAKNLSECLSRKCCAIAIAKKTIRFSEVLCKV